MSKSLPTHIHLAAVLLALCSPPTWSHVPYFEHLDWSERHPFEVRGDVEQSIAVYSWINFEGDTPALDIDYFRFEIDEPSSIYFELLVPACAGYEDSMPWFALLGPGLPPPNQELPKEIELPRGFGAIVVPGPAPGDPRDTLYEPFGGKRYFIGPNLLKRVDVPGDYEIVVWDPYELGGDYVGVLGDAEIWGRTDIIRALIYTPLIRQDRELHIDCLPADIR